MKQLQLLLPLLACLLIVNFPSYLYANEKLAPSTVPGTTKVDVDGVLDLVEKTPDLLIIDSRIHMDRNQGFIEGSISLPDIETNCQSLAKLIPKTDSSVLFYCNGVKCGRSVKASIQALACGYSNIYWFRGGFEEWIANELPVIKP